MKKSWIVSLVAMLAAMTATAQVEKQVEVTKAYVPSLEQATKLKIEPDMTDTMTLRPEIDYTITPLTLQTTLATRPIRPVTVTYCPGAGLGQAGVRCGDGREDCRECRHRRQNRFRRCNHGQTGGQCGHGEQNSGRGGHD